MRNFAIIFALNITKTNVFAWLVLNYAAELKNNRLESHGFDATNTRAIKTN